ncbi:PREDICTED: neurotrypsin-like [Amphimedon queenslandica]|nr:PREDICTED: neurotrypsin-like [Amphimedon queenslandica]XP_019861761.1 PREDICTED: neurotrypsin-like [Amphimedon queenslandica]|eukprot:XP_019861760.1 PREDICTED: neurotrypsin-like [Amphimedon queenslandica]
MDKTNVICLIFAALLFNVNGQGNGAVRLNNYGNTDVTNTRGVVEVYFNSRWGPICIKDSSYNHIGDVVCHQLGFNGGSSGSVSHDNPLNTEAVLTTVTCEKDMLVILQCRYETSVSSCEPSESVEVHCNTARLSDNPYNGMVRLQGGYYSGQGMVEIYCKESWKAVCNDDQFFKGEAADVVCVQLGYNGYQHYDKILYNGSAWLHGVDCKSESSSKCLSDCSGGSCRDSFFRCTSYGVNVTCKYDTQNSDEGGHINTCKIKSSRADSGLSGGAIAGIVLGAFAVIFAPLCACCCYILWIRIKSKRKDPERIPLQNKPEKD